MKNKKFYILSFVIPIMVITLVLFVNKFIFGNNSILVSDMWYQYYGLFVRLKEILEGTGSLFYTFRIGLGQSFITTFAYYLASPLNLLLYLFNNIESAMLFIIILKIGLCGLFMFIYLKHHFSKENSKLLLFSTAYALSLQVIANYFNIMWLDAYYLAPLVLLGIDKIIKERKSFLYFISLFLTISINYYMGYMVCLFSVIYFIYKIYLYYKKNDKYGIKQIIKKFIIVSVLAGLASMVINLPNLFGIISIERTDSFFDVKHVLNSNIFESIPKLFFGSHSFNELINITFFLGYFGLFTLLNLILYFFNKNIDKKEKKASLILLIILILSISFNILNKIWHVFNSPIGFNYRYYFLFIIFFIYLSCKNFIKLDNSSIKKYICIIVLVLFIGVLYLIFDELKIKSLVISLILIVIYCGILYFYNNKSSNKILKICLLFLVLGELYFNYFDLFSSVEFYSKEYIEYRSLIKNNSINEVKNVEDSKFYRIEFSNSMNNDAMTYNYNSSTSWYSTLNSKINKFLSNFGYVTMVNEYNHIDLPIIDSILNIKYIVNTYIEDIDGKTLKELEKLKEDEYNMLLQNHKIEENKYALELGYMADSSVLKGFECENAYDCQNILASQMSGKDIKYYTKGTVQQENYEYSIELESKNDFLIRFPANQGHEYDDFSYDVYLNDNYMQTINQDSGFVSHIENNAKVGTKINISIKNIKGNLKNDKLSIYYKDESQLEKMYETLSSNQLELETIEDGYIKGKVEATEDKKILFLSIPYENGWNIKVDGKDVDIIKIYDTFLGVQLEPGTHEVEFTYTTPGITAGIVISLTSISLYGVYFYFERKKNMK